MFEHIYMTFKNIANSTPYIITNTFKSDTEQAFTPHHQLKTVVSYILAHKPLLLQSITHEHTSTKKNNLTSNT